MAAERSNQEGESCGGSQVSHFLTGLKLPFGWLLSWYFYGAGDLAYRILCKLDDHEWWVNLWYPVYNHNMLLSADLQEWVGMYGKWWPWGEPRELSDT